VNSSSYDSLLEIDCKTLKTKIDAGEKFLLLDCREREEHEFVSIGEAELIPMSEMQERHGELEPHRQTEIIVYCHHGIRSLQVTQWLLQQGFSAVKSLSGGIDQWAQEIESSLPRY
jgi:rhodanese-related sulfurtransferase